MPWNPDNWSITPKEGEWGYENHQQNLREREQEKHEACVQNAMAVLNTIGITIQKEDIGAEKNISKSVINKIIQKAQDAFNVRITGSTKEVVLKNNTGFAQHFTQKILSYITANSQPDNEFSINTELETYLTTNNIKLYWRPNNADKPVRPKTYGLIDTSGFEDENRGGSWEDVTNDAPKHPTGRND